VRDLVTDRLDQAAVRCFVDVASMLGIKTVAEYVDDADVLRTLRGMGVDLAQGFLIHRPAPIGQLLAPPPGDGADSHVSGAAMAACSRVGQDASALG
jgi:EAL domain-containing protein (putative c-di-GMP-specific phosphodiesterase class I)